MALKGLHRAITAECMYNMWVTGYQDHKTVDAVIRVRRENENLPPTNRHPYDARECVRYNRGASRAHIKIDTTIYYFV